MTKQGWKMDADKTAAKAAERAKSARASKPKAPFRGTRNIARDTELDTVPVEHWLSSHLSAYYLRRYREAYPDRSRVSHGSILNNRQLRHLKDLREVFRNTTRLDDDAAEYSMIDLKDYIDWVFDNLVRLTQGLKLEGMVTPGVLLAYKDRILGDKNGTAVIGRSLAAALVDDRDDILSGFGGGSSEAL